jgi:hypothetical protein
VLTCPAALAAGDTDRDNVVVVLDASGSMGDSIDGVRKMAAAKDALKVVLAQLPDNVNVGILVFPSDGWIYKLGPKDLTRINAAIDRIDDGGGTPLGEYIKRGADALLKQREAQFGYGSYRLIVVTDGEASDSRLMERYTPEVVARGINLDVIGVGMGQRHTLAKYAHTYRSADDPASLQTAVKEAFAEVTARDTGGAADEDAFAIVSGLPDSFCQAAIEALSKTGNYPIGERPPQRVATTPGDSTSPGNTGSGNSGSAFDGCGCDSGSRGCGCGTFGGLILLIVLGYFGWRWAKSKGHI